MALLSDILGAAPALPAAATKEFNVAVGSAWPAATAKTVSFTFTNVGYEVFHIEFTWVSVDPANNLHRMMVQANCTIIGKAGSSALLLGSLITLNRTNSYTPGAFGTGQSKVTFTVTKAGAPTATVDNLFARVVSTSAASVDGLTVTIP